MADDYMSSTKTLVIKDFHQAEVGGSLSWVMYLAVRQR